jgi:hypothetical protein
MKRPRHNGIHIPGTQNQTFEEILAARVTRGKNIPGTSVEPRCGAGLPRVNHAAISKG